MNLDIKTVSIDDNDWYVYADKVRKFISSKQFSDKLNYNYTIQSLRISTWIGLSVYETDEDNILGFSSMMNRKEFYGNGCRILNRFIKSENYRFAVDDIKYTKQMIEQQIELASKLGFSYAFMSREKKFSTNAFKYFLHHKMEWPQWVIEKDMYYLCKGDDSCKQHISWLPLSKECTSVDLEKVEK